MVSNWIVRMRCVVIKEVCVDGCSESEAEHNPWNYAHEEIEVDQVDWEVLSVKENK